MTLTLGNLGYEMQTLQMGRGFETPGFYLPLRVVFFKKAKCPCQSPVTVKIKGVVVEFQITKDLILRCCSRFWDCQKDDGDVNIIALTS